MSTADQPSVTSPAKAKRDRKIKRIHDYGTRAAAYLLFFILIAGVTVRITGAAEVTSSSWWVSAISFTVTLFIAGKIFIDSVGNLVAAFADLLIKDEETAAQ